jgi:hypothetical protein
MYSEYFENLRNSLQIEGVVVIVDDNAQLTPENRRRASQSFGPSHDHETGRRPCRWSTSPIAPKKASPLKSKKSGMHNASCEAFKQTTSGLPPMDYSSRPKRSVSLSPTTSPVTPPLRPSLIRSKSFTAPKLPERILSPAGRRKVKRGEDNNNSSSRKSSESWSDLLGVMAPTTTIKNNKSSSSKRSASERSTKKKVPLQQLQRETAVVTTKEPSPVLVTRELPSILRDFKLTFTSSPTRTTFPETVGGTMEGKRNWAGEVIDYLDARDVVVTETC